MNEMFVQYILKVFLEELIITFVFHVAALLKYVQISFGNADFFRSKHFKVAEIPFHSTTQYHLSIHENLNKSGYLLLMKGAPEKIFDLCSTILINGEEMEISKKLRKKFTKTYTHFCTMGERVFGFCEFHLPPEKFPYGFPFDTEDANFPIKDFCFLGLISLVDPPRPGKILHRAWKDNSSRGLLDFYVRSPKNDHLYMTSFDALTLGWQKLLVCKGTK